MMYLDKKIWRKSWWCYRRRRRRPPTRLHQTTAAPRRKFFASMALMSLKVSPVNYKILVNTQGWRAVLMEMVGDYAGGCGSAMDYDTPLPSSYHRWRSCCTWLFNPRSARRSCQLEDPTLSIHTVRSFGLLAFSISLGCLFSVYN